MKVSNMKKWIVTWIATYHIAQYDVILARTRSSAEKKAARELAKWQRNNFHAPYDFSLREVLDGELATLRQKIKETQKEIEDTKKRLAVYEATLDDLQHRFWAIDDEEEYYR